MSGSSFGQLLRLTTFGESHGPALGAVVDGMPAGIPAELPLLQAALDRRRPGRLKGGTARNEADQAEILSGVFEGRTLGTPICVVVRNTNQRSQDYKTLKRAYRPGHADETTMLKHGFRDHRGGGRSSGRETLARVIGGHFAALLLPGVEVVASVEKMGDWTHSGPTPAFGPEGGTLGEWQQDAVAWRGRYGVPDADDAAIEAMLLELKSRGESIGGRCRVSIRGVPAGLGAPVFRKLKSDLAGALMSIGAVTSFDYGLGAGFADAYGTQVTADRRNFGGIEGGISSGAPIELHVTVRPPSTVGEKARAGRHDPCIVPRVLPVLEAMTWLVLADHLLLQSAIDAHQPRPNDV